MFSGTQDKCKACEKTVYWADQLAVDGALYHKACFRCHHCKRTLQPRTPSKIASFFSGTVDKCISCGKIVYPLEKVSVEGLPYHKSCFKCVHGGCFITPSNYAALEGRLYCKHHYSQLFKEKGNYSQLVRSPPVKVISTQGYET